MSLEQAHFAPVAPARRRLVTRVVCDGRRLGLSTAPIEDASRVWRGLSAVWFAPRHMWTFRQPEAGERFAAGLAQSFGRSALVDLDDLGADVDRAIASPCEGFFTQMMDVQILPLEQGGHAVSSVYDPLLVEAMRRLGGRFHRHAAAWQVAPPVATILRVLREVADVPETYVFVHERAMRLEDLVAKPKAEMPIKVAAATPRFGEGGGDDEALGRGFLSSVGSPLTSFPLDEALIARAIAHCGLYDFQGDGVRHLLARSSALLGDDMGLGKSRQAVVASRIAASKGRVLVVCPASLRINWEREIHAVFPKDVVGMVGEDRMETLRGCRWVIANYERLGGLVRETDLAFAVMTVDEAHYLKEHQAGRTRNAFILADRIPRRFLLTGTPILSREIEVHTLLRISGHPVGQLELADFRKRFAGGAEQRGALSSVLSDWMLRRSKSVLKNLGLKTRQVRYVTPAEGLGAYHQVFGDMTLMVMPKIVKLRQSLEAMKLDFVVETVESLHQADKIIIFCEYIETVETLKTAFTDAGIGCVSLVGSDAMAKRQRAVDAFQTDPACRVFIGTTSAAGVGITLTAANYVLFAALPWTPAMMRQAEDRAYRNGQTRDVIVLVPMVPETIDEQFLALLESKTELEQDVVESAVLRRLATVH